MWLLTGEGSALLSLRRRPPASGVWHSRRHVHHPWTPQPAARPTERRRVRQHENDNNTKFILYGFDRKLYWLQLQLMEGLSVVGIVEFF